MLVLSQLERDIAGDRGSLEVPEPLLADLPIPVVERLRLVYSPLTESVLDLPLVADRDPPDQVRHRTHL